MWFCRPLDRLLSLLLAGLLHILWMLSALTAGSPFLSSALCYDKVLADSCLSTSLGASSTTSLLDVWTCIYIVCWRARCHAMVWTS